MCINIIAAHRCCLTNMPSECMISCRGDIRAVNHRHAIQPAGSGIHHGSHGGHPGATGEDARPLSDIEGQIHRLRCGRRELAAGRLRLTGKALDSLQTLWYPPWTLPKDV